MTVERSHVTDTPRLAPLRRGDLARCAELEQALFPGEDPWSRAAFQSELDQGHCYLGAYDAADRLVGYAGIALVGRPPHTEAEVHTIGVDPAHQRAGVGRSLLEALLTEADQHGATTFLEVRTNNDAAIALYHEYGFEIVGLRRRYYQPSGADAHTMRRSPRASARPKSTAENDGDSTVERRRHGRDGGGA